MKPKILKMENKYAIPFDFNINTFNAIEYALNATSENDIINIIHVDNTIIRSGSNDVLIQKIIDSIKYNLKLKELPSRINIIILVGMIRPQLKEHINSNYYDYVILGTKDTYTTLDNWIGDITLDLVKGVNSPLLIIPKYSKFKPYKKVIVASDYHLSEKALLHQIKTWNKPHNAFIKFLNVKDSLSNDPKFDKEKVMEVMLESQPADFAFETTTINSTDVSGSLLAMAYNENADLLLVVTENNNYIHQLLFKSLSKEIIQKSTIPVLFIHS